MESPSRPSPAASSGRGRGKSRGGLGKYLRARGRGRGSGRPAEFHKRLLLEGEEAPQGDEDEDAEEALERQQKYSRRQLGTNADRYAEQEPELGSDGEPQVEPEVDLSAFLERQRITDAPGPSMPPAEDDGDVDHSLAHMLPQSGAVPSKKGRLEQIEWDDELDELSREKAAAEAVRDLKTRFRAKSERMLSKPVRNIASERKAAAYVDAPALPPTENTRPKDPMKEMEDFLDDLLT